MTPVIAGIGCTPFTRAREVSAAALAARAILAALADAGIDLEEVDGVVRFDREAAWEYDLPGVSRLRALHWYGAVPDTAGSAPALLRLAAMAITQELAGVVVGYHARAEPRAPEAADASGATQGGGAFVVIADGRAPGVRVLASMQAAIPSAARHPGAWRASRRAGVVRAAALDMFAGAGLAPGDVDVACLYAHPPALVDLARDDYGPLRARLNPHAGGPRAAALDGIDDLLEAVREVRAGARLALVAGSPLEPTSAVLLGRSP